MTVEIAREAGAVGARMTGGGFGGSAIALVPSSGCTAVRQRSRPRSPRAGGANRASSRPSLGRRRRPPLLTTRVSGMPGHAVCVPTRAPTALYRFPEIAPQGVPDTAC